VDSPVLHVYAVKEERSGTDWGRFWRWEEIILTELWVGRKCWRVCVQDILSGLETRFYYFGALSLKQFIYTV